MMIIVSSIHLIVSQEFCQGMFFFNMRAFNVEIPIFCATCQINYLHVVFLIQYSLLPCMTLYNLKLSEGLNTYLRATLLYTSKGSMVIGNEGIDKHHA